MVVVVGRQCVLGLLSVMQSGSVMTKGVARHHSNVINNINEFMCTQWM